jgi:transketolase
MLDLDSRSLALSIRRHSLQMVSRGRSAHVGSIFSVADIVSVLYARILNVDPAQPNSLERDRFVLAKGHAAAAVYACLAECGFFPVERLQDYYQDGSDLCGHMSHKGVAGVELSTGSLGHGLSVAAGMALAAKRAQASHRVFVVLSDGECDEGSTWEPVMFAAHHRLDNLVAVVDYNRIQALGTKDETLGMEPFADKWRAFGWAVSQVDGHDHAALEASLSGVPFASGKPSCVIARTTKGKGVSFMENSILWHYRTPLGDELAAAVAEITGHS